MKILTTSTESQTISFIPREYILSATLYIRDDSTNITTNQDVTLIQVADELVYTGNFNLIEGRFYDFNFIVDPNLWEQNSILWDFNLDNWENSQGASLSLYKNRIFCTDQVLDQTEDEYYSVNKNQYVTENTFDNEYIII
jgi:hypothetical protein